MIREYLNKEAYITIILSAGTLNGGASTMRMCGKIVRYNEEFAEIEYDPNHKCQKEMFARLHHTSGKMLVRSKFISTIALI